MLGNAMHLANITASTAVALACVSRHDTIDPVERSAAEKLGPHKLKQRRLEDKFAGFALKRRKLIAQFHHFAAGA